MIAPGYIPTLLLLTVLVYSVLLFPQLHAGESRSVPGIKGEDDRVLVDGASPPWQAIGRFNQAGLGHCSGVLISPEKVLTAAHCVWNQRTNKPYPGKYLHFVAGYHKEDYLAASRVRHIQLAPDYRAGLKKPAATAEDWAIVTLAKPMLQVRPLPLLDLDAGKLQKLLGKGTPFLQAGFSRDRPYIMTADNHCQVEDFTGQGRLLVHQCDAVSGDSGSPIMVRQDGQLRMIAMHVATVKQGQSPLGLAVLVSGIPVSIVLSAGVTWSDR